MKLGASYSSMLLLYNLCVFFICKILKQIVFFLTNWEEQHMGVLRTGVGPIGVTEGQDLVILIALITGILGNGIWNIFTRLLIILPATIGQFSFVVVIFKRVLSGNQHKFQALSLLIPITMITLLSLFWIHTEFYLKYPGLVILTTGINFYIITIRMIIATVTKVFLIRV